jgi:RNA polymerase-binding transcription factor DksA
MDPGGVSVASGKPIPEHRLGAFSTVERTAAGQERLDRSGRQVR